jgi:integrase
MTTNTNATANTISPPSPSSSIITTTNILERKIAIATEGLLDYVVKRLRNIKLEENIEAICDYIIAMNAEINPNIIYKKNQLLVLSYLSGFYNDQKSFLQMKRDDVLGYLDSLRKPEISDPYHKWIGTYDLRRVYLLRFFKWLHYPHLEPKKRPVPTEVMVNIPKLKRKEQSTIKPSDLWIAADDLLFLKYCSNKRDKAYHAIARDSSCRPSEILNLRIRDLHFKTSGSNQYAEIVVNGKTGNRSIPLFAALPYVKDWIDDHPQGQNPNTFLIPSLDKRHKRFGNRMKETSLNLIYRRYKIEFFPALLEDPKVVPEDKKKIRELLRKPWNPYIYRHSALTAKSKILRENVLRQHSGWSARSQMHLKYIHYFGNESNENLLEAYGIVTEANKGNVLLPDSLRPRQCPNCNESNIPDCKFCSKCRMVLNYDAYEETIEDQKRKDQQLKNLEFAMNEQKQVQAVQQSLLEAIAKTMNIHNSGVMERDLNDKNSDLNAGEFKKLTYKKKLQTITEIKQDTNKVIQTILLPEIVNISKYMKENNVQAVNESIARIMSNKMFRDMFFDITADPDMQDEINRREEDK